MEIKMFESYKFEWSRCLINIQIEVQVRRIQVLRFSRKAFIFFKNLITIFTFNLRKVAVNAKFVKDDMSEKAELVLLAHIIIGFVEEISVVGLYLLLD